MEKKFRDPESKNKIKQLKTDAHKQIERNKVILKDLITKYQSGKYVDLLQLDRLADLRTKTTGKIIWREGELITTIWIIIKLLRIRMRTRLR